MGDRLWLGLPDTRLAGFRKKAHHIVLPDGRHADELFCYFCGTSCGYVINTFHGYALCDECVGTKGTPPGLVPTPEDVARGFRDH